MRVFLLEDAMRGKITMERIRGRAGQQQRERILRRDRGICQACSTAGRLTIGRHVDHIVALTNGGTNSDDNMQVLCVACHVIKTAQDKGHVQRTRFDANGNPIGKVKGWNDSTRGGGVEFSEGILMDTVVESLK